MILRIANIFLCALALLLTSCNFSYNKVLKSTDPAFKVAKAKEYYEQGKYEKAIPLFEEHLTLNKGIKNSEEILYLYADAHYKMKDFAMASFYFRNFVSSYPNSKRVEDAAFMIAKSFEEESPRYSLDQSNTQKAIDQYQLFINRYSKSNRVADANAAIDALRAKLHKKAYESAYLYYKIKQYQAASVSFKALLKDFPDIENRGKIQYYVIKSLQAYAEKSYDIKKSERFQETAKECALFLETYPDNAYKIEVEQIYKNVLEQIKSLEDGKTNSREEERGN